MRVQRLREASKQNLLKTIISGGDQRQNALAKRQKKGLIMKKHTYSISHNDKTITLTKAYAKKANTPGTKEFKELANLHKAYPDYDIVMRTATVSDSKEVHDGLTVEVMEKIIARQPNAEALKKEYDEFVAFWGKEVKDKKTGKMVMRAPYGKTKSWFLKKVPNYQSIDFSQKVEANQSEEQTPATENGAEQANVN